MFEFGMAVRKAASRSDRRPRVGAATAAALLAPITFTLVAGCAAGPSAAPSPIAPKLFMNERGLKQWDRPEAFGPVPADLLDMGREYCATLNNGGKRYSPTGYHPNARTVEGYPLEDGGFYCTQD